MAQKFANAARAALSAGITSGDTTITIASGGSLFPEIVSPDFSRAVLQDNSGIEIVLITAHTANATSFTVTRGQEGTTARSFDAGAIFGIRVTAADMDEALDAVNLATEVTGTLPIANGGTGETTRQAAMDALAGAVTSGQYLRGNGTDVVMSALQAADITGTVAIANGGTGLTSPGTSGNVLTSNGTDWVSSPAPATGVTAVSIATANGFAGTSSGGSTPILTMSTSITGLLQGNGTAVSAVTIGSGLSFSSGTLSATAQSSLGQTRAIAINCILP